MKLISVHLNGKNCDADVENPLNIAIPLDFNGDQPNAYDVEKAASTAYETGDLVGDTRRGGSCNFEQINFIPHCNGTHTECVGHLTNARISVHDCLKDSFIPAILISVAPEKADQSGENYSIPFAENDELITRKSIENRLNYLESEILNLEFHKIPHALIIRTLPNDESKLAKTYLKEIPPFFSTEAMEFLRERNVKHLLVDMPSIDRIFDEGKLSNHRIFWRVEQGSFETNEQSLVHNTITELIYVSNEIKDGAYLLNLQIAPFAADASPSRPVLFKLKL